MSTLLEEYTIKRNELYSQIKEMSLPIESLPLVQELIYRISVLETLQKYCKTAPNTMDTKELSTHFRMIYKLIGFMIEERKLNTKLDDDGKLRLETALSTFQSLINDIRKRFQNYSVLTKEQYHKDIINLVNAVLPVWIQYRNTYISF